MRGFQLCAPCDTEYRDVRDRRFHAEPVACARCGPELRLVAGRERVENDGRRVLDRAVSVLRAGGIAAVKGIGGYHLLCDATSGDAVARLRVRKRRPTKPLAVMFPHGRRDALDRVRAYVELAPEEAEALLSPARPIVLARRLPSDIAEDVASGLDELGVMLPYTPLHELLLAAFDAPLVATSGNPSGEPLVTTAEDAERELGNVADVFVHHDRPIVRPVDDAVVRRIAGRMRTIRIGRGLAPLEADLPRPAPAPTLAVGGHMKNTVALAWGNRLVLSPHIGDLDGARSVDAFAATAEDLPALFRMTPEHLLADAHPDYASARWASGRGVPVSAIQHHAAHASAVAGEDPSVPRWLVFAWDGVGLGSDGTLWGGEGFVGRPGAWRRWSSFRPFRVPGATRSGREPWRSAAGMFWEAHLQEPIAIPGARHLARRAWEKGINSPATSAVGRIFDAAAAILLGLERYGHEAEGPMRLEALARGGEAVELPLARDERGVLRADWAPLLETLVDDAQPIEARAGALHASLVDAAVAQAEVARAELDVHTVGLAGGVFQNRKLTESLTDALSQRGFDVRLNELIPMGDGGLAYGQVMEYLGSLHGDR
jgi:hydrogenase maturation protein HypF